MNDFFAACENLLTRLFWSLMRSGLVVFFILFGVCAVLTRLLPGLAFPLVVAIGGLAVVRLYACLEARFLDLDVRTPPPPRQSGASTMMSLAAVAMATLGVVSCIHKAQQPESPVTWPDWYAYPEDASPTDDRYDTGNHILFGGGTSAPADPRSDSQGRGFFFNEGAEGERLDGHRTP